MLVIQLRNSCKSPKCSFKLQQTQVVQERANCRFTWSNLENSAQGSRPGGGPGAGRGGGPGAGGGGGAGAGGGGGAGRAKVNRALANGTQTLPPIYAW